MLAALQQALPIEATTSRLSLTSSQLAQCDDLGATETSLSERANSAMPPRRSAPAHASPGLEPTAPGAQRRSGRLRRRSHDRECGRPRTRRTVLLAETKARPSDQSGAHYLRKRTTVRQPSPPAPALFRSAVMLSVEGMRQDRGPPSPKGDVLWLAVGTPSTRPYQSGRGRTDHLQQRQQGKFSRRASCLQGRAVVARRLSLWCASFQTARRAPAPALTASHCPRSAGRT